MDIQANSSQTIHTQFINMIIPQFSKPSKQTTAALALLLPVAVQGQSFTTNHTSQTSTGFAPCDSLIAANLSSIVHLPSSPLYSTLVAGSWAKDTQRAPWCFVTPCNTDEVSKTVVALKDAGNGAGDWHIAIRSGGHGGGSQNSIEQGVIVDLSRMNDTTFDAQTEVASVGSGARWGEVYAELEKFGVGVTGGREAIVGVGGLILGGGLSWYTAREGFACDNVVNFEVVLANGEIVNANATDNSDLFRALKGGSSNFGIVTKFDLKTFPADKLSIDQRTISSEHAGGLIDAIADFTDLDQTFHDNAMIAMMMYNPQQNATIITVKEINTMGKVNSTVFDAINRIPTLAPAKKQTVTLADSAKSAALEANTRNVGVGPLVIANDPQVMRYCVEQHEKLIEDLKKVLGPNEFATIQDFQPFPSYFADIGVQKGGNMLGLERSSRNKIMTISGVILLTPNSEKQYPQVYQRLSAMTESIKAFAKSVGSDEELIYLPYANPMQDAIGSYGPANVEHIRKVAEKFDPSGFFQHRVPGGFKISRVN
ncbi:unnamed protein product [Periconia digitata]|uniref:FAD-binding PCMH-type domain-containing protein n=1 Tax=Periconia digitata TaxID=1303443 RepID=A0A9W4U3C5_9PLEO|nr:unnamed protein product [Periconia digitata]